MLVAILISLLFSTIISIVWVHIIDKSKEITEKDLKND
jgi:hypothetical protein